ncbi:L-glyceraldehyde 3-phosphate reductase [Sedimentisphaera cyanobacteriorum]|uniref:L-glyceraldehyde 3-phosphate reductase n=1 Tax=Sedimentisphaera cyanobacteriorum TaxID=1940790 RepID=A0A1Q2HS88_9BACT|nr:aldo/keto reductase [Sedimentisphaera cyanobacteriorum]AQQ10317.1 L-glyceraldehyde 3-phosphate reductase [Sedimentisphaera cyanobacteriorum]
MIYKTFGKTGYKVSAVGFGGMRFDLNHSNLNNSYLLDHAWDKGINFFDTAPAYCEDNSLDIFGHFCERTKSIRDQYYVSSKIMPQMVTSAKDTIEQVDKALKRLNTDYIDFFYVWCIRNLNQYDEAAKPDGLIEGLEKCREQGKIRHINVSSHLRGKRLNKVLEKRDFAGILVGVNILNFMFRWDAVETAYKNGAGVVAMNPLAGGMIPKHEERFSFISNGSESPTDAALKFCIGSPEITVALNGFTTKEHINQACRCADQSSEISKERKDEIAELLSDNFDELCTACGYCDSECPKRIPVSSYMQFYNRKLIENKSDKELLEALKFSREWGILNDRTGEAADCIKCKRCEEACTQHLNITERLEHLERLEERLKEENQKT